MKKYIIKIIILFVSIISVGCNPFATRVNLAKNVQIKFNGADGSGIISFSTVNLQIKGVSPEKLKEFKNTFEYSVSAYTELSNGDIIEIIINYDESLAEELNLDIIQNVIKVKVSNLKEVTGTTEFNGYEIPENWDMTDEEKEIYVEYLQSLEQVPPIGYESKIPDYIWYLGDSEIETQYSDREFYNNDYQAPIQAYNAAYDYGKNSSQQFKIEAIGEEANIIGYVCKFKSENVTRIEEDNINALIFKYWPVLVGALLIVIVIAFILIFNTQRMKRNEI